MALPVKFLVYLGVVALYAWVLRALVRALGGPREGRTLGLWNAAAHMLAAGACARGTRWLLKSQEFPVQVTAAILVYALALATLLAVVERVPFVRGLLIGIAMEAIAAVSAVALVLAGVL